MNLRQPLDFLKEFFFFKFLICYENVFVVENIQDFLIYLELWNILGCFREDTYFFGNKYWILKIIIYFLDGFEIDVEGAPRFLGQ